MGLPPAPNYGPFLFSARDGASFLLPPGPLLVGRVDWKQPYLLALLVIRLCAIRPLPGQSNRVDRPVPLDHRRMLLPYPL